MGILGQSTIQLGALMGMVRLDGAFHMAAPNGGGLASCGAYIVALARPALEERSGVASYVAPMSFPSTGESGTTGW